LVVLVRAIPSEWSDKAAYSAKSLLPIRACGTQIREKQSSNGLSEKIPVPG